MADTPIRFDDGKAYEQFMGKWSRPAGEVFLDWLAPQQGLSWTNGISQCSARSVTAILEVTEAKKSSSRPDDKTIHELANASGIQSLSGLRMPCHFIFENLGNGCDLLGRTRRFDLRSPLRPGERWEVGGDTVNCVAIRCWPPHTASAHEIPPCRRRVPNRHPLPQRSTLRLNRVRLRSIGSMW